MIRALQRFFPLVVLLILITPCLASPAMEVKDVRVGVYPDKTRIVIDLSRAAEFKAFLMGNPERLVVDLPLFAWRAPSITAAPGSGITAIRHGSVESSRGRIVFELQQGGNIRSAFALPRDSEKPDRLVIDFTPGDAVSSENQKTYRAANLAGFTPPAPPVPPAQKSLPRAKYIVVLDPGHGGVDPGATGANDVAEKNVVLALARELRKQLEASGRYEVFLTRDSDTFIKLSDRVKFARQKNADLFVSIHADSINKAGVSGASIYTLSETASDEQTAKLAERENRADLIAGIDLSHEDEDVANILVDIAMRDTMNQSKFFANKVVNSFGQRRVSLLESPHRHAGFAVLKAPDIPSVLVEAGFMSNKREASLLATTEHRRKIANAMKEGIDRYFDHVDKMKGF